MRRLMLSTRRKSAGTKLPASSRTRSPGTRSRAGNSWSTPPRRTRTFGTANFLSAAIARSARYSWKNPNKAKSSTMARMAIASCHLPKKPEMTAAATRIKTMVAVNCSHKILKGLRPPCSASSLGPTCWRRVVTSVGVKPLMESLFNSFAVSFVVRWYQFMVKPYAFMKRLLKKRDRHDDIVRSSLLCGEPPCKITAASTTHPERLYCRTVSPNDYCHLEQPRACAL